MNIFLQNTLTGKKEEFWPIEEGLVKMYNCGPTVYGRQHLGNLSMFVFTDVLRRALEYTGLTVNQVINITDFGHLASDNDEGEDKMTRGLKAEGLDINMENMRGLARKYADIFLSDIKELNVKTEGTKFPYASDYIGEERKLIERLEEKGFTYKTSDGIYFDTDKFKDYGKLGKVNQGDERRIGENSEKKNRKDFALWKSDKNLGWKSRWGKGFPGWHIECSAMIFALLGEQIDIHTGGIEHIGIHHNNEIAQAETASGKSPFSRFWLHREHIQIGDEKISKSIGNVLYLSDLKKHKIHPLSFRYWLLTGRYNTPMNFTWEAVAAAQKAFEDIVIRYAIEMIDAKVFPLDNNDIQDFEKAISDNLNTPIVIVILQKMVSRYTIDKIDAVLGLNIKNLAQEIQNIPDNIKKMEEELDEARKNNDFIKSDRIRANIVSLGYKVQNLPLKTLILRGISGLI